MPLHKGGDPSQLDNYHPISKLSAVAKVLENLVNSQFKDFLYNNSVLSQCQSCFRAKHSTITAVSKVVGDILHAQDKKNHCVSLFIDLSKAFYTVGHSLLLYRLKKLD
jgi:hypothetical protein